jgi:hypothetical protein
VLAAASYCDDLRAPVPVPTRPATIAPTDAATPDAGEEDAGNDDGGAAPTPEELATIAALKTPPRRKLPRLQTPRLPRKGWPVTCPYDLCLTSDAEPGYRCQGVTECFNPCPVGMAPGDIADDNAMCLRLCNTGADCPDRKCVYGLCVTPQPADRADRTVTDPPCSTPDGRQGYKVEGDPVCYPHCKKGLVLYGGDRCAKPCRRDTECPGGSCGVNETPSVCVPVCTSEGCPYPWE